jgi:hypothetical protein
MEFLRFGESGEKALAALDLGDKNRWSIGGTLPGSKQSNGYARRRICHAYAKARSGEDRGEA